MVAAPFGRLFFIPVHDCRQVSCNPADGSLLLPGHEVAGHLSCFVDGQLALATTRLAGADVAKDIGLWRDPGWSFSMAWPLLRVRPVSLARFAVPGGLN